MGLTRIAGKLRRAGLTPLGIFEALRADNDSLCQSPLPESELRTIAYSIGVRDGGPLRTQTTETSSGLVVIGADEFASIEFPSREYLLEPWFQEKNLTLLYAPRGVGKTILATGIALAVSSGGQFLRWNASRAKRVLYVDGELPEETLQKRIRDVAKASGLAITGNLLLLYAR